MGGNSALAAIDLSKLSQTDNKTMTRKKEVKPHCHQKKL
jgi:hypothetical protein